MLCKQDVFYETEAGVLMYGDCMSVLDGLIAEGQRFDLIFADPPYFLSNGGTTVHAGKRVKVDKGDWDKSKGLEADYAFTYEWIKRCKLLLTDTATLWVSGTLHNIYMVGYVLQQLGFVILNDIVWYKPNAPPHLACRYFAHAHETLLWAKKAKGAKHVFDYARMKEWNANGDFVKRDHKQMRSVWVIPLTPQKEKRWGKHPTQKPAALLKRIILACTQKGDKVLDPFCGSGTTAVVAARYGRTFVGIDHSMDYLHIAQKRLQNSAHEKPF